MLDFKKSIAISLVMSSMILSTGCGGGSSASVITATKVALEDLNNTNLKNQGYIINVDIEDNQGGTYTAQDISYVYCTNGVNVWDYFAVTSDQLPWNGSQEPNYDYGELVLGTRLAHTGFILGGYALATTDYVEEGITYNLLTNYAEPGNEAEVGGTVKVNSINDFNCSILAVP